jgi:hypothetical protein
MEEYVKELVIAKTSLIFSLLTSYLSKKMKDIKKPE